MKWPLIAAVALLAVISAGAGVYLRFQEVVVQPITEPDTDVIRQKVEYDKMTGKINILIMGEDNVEESRRSDTVAVAAVDLDNGNVRVLSLPRDTRVEIPKKGWQKLNHAYAYGGADLMRATVSKMLDIPLHYYVLVNYDSFPKIIDILGGIDVYVPKKMRYIDRAGKLDINIPAGQQHLDGKSALHYVRFRHDALGDIGRVQRQQLFLKAVLEKLKLPENLSKIPELITEMTNMLQTDLMISQALQIGGFVRDLDRSHVFFLMLPGKPDYISKISYWISDNKAGRDFLSLPLEELELKTTSADNNKPNFNPGVTTATDEPLSAPKEGMSADEITTLLSSMVNPVAILNGVGTGGLGTKAAEHMQKMGIEVTHTGNAKHFDYRYSNIIYPENAPLSVKDTARALGKLCGIPNNLVRPAKQAMFATLVLGKDYQKILDNLSKNYASDEIKTNEEE